MLAIKMSLTGKELTCGYFSSDWYWVLFVDLLLPTGADTHSLDAYRMLRFMVLERKRSAQVGQPGRCACLIPVFVSQVRHCVPETVTSGV